MFTYGSRVCSFFPNFAHGNNVCALCKVFGAAAKAEKETMSSFRQQVLSTMKSRDIEGAFELYVTRTPGYLWALLFRKLGVHPVAVTVLSIVIGCGAGVLFSFSDLGLNVLGMLLLVWANWYDCADGQLARMTGKKTLVGRILDGFAGDLWFFSIYVGIAVRLTPEFGVWIWILELWAGLYCHARQCSLADYYRNAHMLFTGVASELDRSQDIMEEYRSLGWNSRDWFRKLYLCCYASYIRGQEHPTPQLQTLLSALRRKWGGSVPSELGRAYRRRSRPLMPLCQLLTFDARVGVLFASLLAGVPWLYPLLEITVFEALRIYTNVRHERFCKTLNIMWA